MTKNNYPIVIAYTIWCRSCKKFIKPFDGVCHTKEQEVKFTEQIENYSLNNTDLCPHCGSIDVFLQDQLDENGKMI